MLETIVDVAAVVGWPKMLLAGLVVFISLTPRGFAWRAGAAALALAAAAFLVYIDWSEKNRLYGENRTLRQTAREAVIEERVKKIEAGSTRRVIDGMARELMSDDPRALMLHDSATAYDSALTDIYVDRYLHLDSNNNPQMAAIWANNVFVDRMNAELPEAGDNVLHFLAKGYEPLFRKLKDVDPQTCAAFLTGKSILTPRALGEAFFAVELAFRTMPDKTRPVSKGTRADAMAFAERALGRER